MSGRDDPLERHETYLRDARAVFDAAEDGQKKGEAAMHLSLAQKALETRNEVDLLLAIHRAIRALA